MDGISIVGKHLAFQLSEPSYPGQLFHEHIVTNNMTVHVYSNIKNSMYMYSKH